MDKNAMWKVNIHSMVDVITNSSTVIYTYQNSVSQTKELVQEILNLAGITDKTPDDIFYYGVFCEDETYFENDGLPDDAPIVDWSKDSTTRNVQRREQEEWFNNLKLSIMKKEIQQPDWMNNAEENDDWFAPSQDLYLVPKDDKYIELSAKIGKLLNSVSADGGMDG